MDDLLRDFLTESNENLAKLDNDIVELEQHPEDIARLNSVFRTIHTIKGTCGFLDLTRLEGVAHAAENVLDALRAGRLQVRPDLIGDVLAAIDCIKHVLIELERTEREPQGDDSALIAKLEAWLHPLDALPRATPPESTGVTPTALQVSVDAAIASCTRPDAPAAPQPIAAAATPARAADALLSADRASSGLDGIDRRGGNGDAHPSVSDSTLRVGVDVLDKLMNLVGELALGRNQLLQLAASHDDSPFAKPVQQLDRVTTDLLEAVMKTRMQPIGNA